MMRFAVDVNLLEPLYLVTFLQSKFIKNQILSCAKNAVNQSSINQQDVKGFLVNLPPLSLQKNFVKRKQAIEKLKYENIAALTKQTQLFASLQHQAFTGNL
jgi:type I restriction enzyme S subunit